MPSHQQLTYVAPLHLLSKDEIGGCQTFRDASHLAWKHRKDKTLTKERFAALIDAHPPHVSQWLNPKTHDKHGRKYPDLPAEKVAVAEQVLGNHAMQQFLNRRTGIKLVRYVIEEDHE